MKIFSPTNWLVSILTILLTFTTSTTAVFTWTQLPTEMVIGGTYQLNWTGASGDVTIYVKKEPTASSWRAYIWEGPGNTVSVNYTVNDTYTGAGMISGRTYVFAAWDSATAETEYDSPPIYLDNAPTLRKRGRWVEKWF